MTIQEFHALKGQRKLSMLTAYDFWSAQILNRSDVDALLVGDSLAMVMHGHESTLPANTEVIALHTRAVAKGAPHKLIVADLPFLEGQISVAHGMSAVQKLMQAGAHAVKIEGAGPSLPLIQQCVQSGVPVMGHLGLTPQSVHALGGYKVQGRNERQREKIFNEALELEAAGCFSLVLECIPASLGREISQRLSLPVIGIGAGVDTDGQILVLHDLLGMQNQKRPKFVRTYLPGHETLLNAVKDFVSDVQKSQFPSQEESYEL